MKKFRWFRWTALVAIAALLASSMPAGARTAAAAESDIVETGELMDEMFGQSTSWWSNYTVHKFFSGWETNADTYGVDWSSVGRLYMKLMDADDESSLHMKKRFLRQTAGTLTMAFRFKLSDEADGVTWQLREDALPGVVLITDGGNLRYVDDGGNPVTLQSYSAGTEYDIKITADLDNQSADIYVNGVLRATDAPFRNEVGSLNYVYVDTGVEATIDLYHYYFKVYKGYAVYEKFMFSQGNVPDEWSLAAPGGTGALEEWVVSGYRQDQRSFKIDDTSLSDNVALSRSFPALTGVIVAEFAFLLPEQADGYAFTLGDGSTPAVQLVTDDGSVHYLDAGPALTELQELRDNLWYHVKIQADIAAKKADIYINRQLQAAGVDFANPVASIDRFEISSSDAGTGVLWADDIFLYPFRELPGDYVPEPEPAEHSPYLLGMQAFSTWRDGNHNGYDWILPYEASHQSYLGWYTDGNTEAQDWQIKWMVEHGIDFVMQSWVRYERGNPIKDVWQQYTHDQFFNAEYSDLMQYAIMNNAHYSDMTDFRDNVVPYFIETFFRDPRYLKIDNKPVLFVLSASEEETRLKYALNDNFNNLNEGSKPTEWRLDDSAGDIVIAAVPPSGKAAELHDSSNSASSSMTRSFLAESGPLILEARLTAAQTNHGLDMYLMDGATEVARVRFHSSGNISYVDGSGEHAIQSYTDDVEYKVTVVADASTDRFDIYVDDELEADRRLFVNNADSIDTVKFESFNSTSGVFAIREVTVEPLTLEYNHFNGQTAGSDPADWALNENAGDVSVQNVPSSTDRSARIVDSSAGDGSGMTRTFLKRANYSVRNAYDYLRQQCIEAGFDGVLVLLHYGGNDVNELQRIYNDGYDNVFSYGWATDNIESQKNNMIAQRNTLAGMTDKPGMVPTLSSGWYPVPWGGTGGGFAEAGKFRELADWTKETFMPSLPSDSLGRELVMLDNWDEYGEGHFMMPSGLTGFGYLDALRDVFGSDPSHEDAIPTDAQRERLNTLYPRSFGNGSMQINRRSFEFYTYPEKWTAGSDIDGFAWESGGYIGGRITGDDPMLLSADGLGIPIDSGKVVKIGMKNSTNATNASLFFITDSDTDWDGDKMQTFAVNAADSGYTEYTVDMSTVASWTGVLKQLRIDPIEEVPLNDTFDAQSTGADPGDWTLDETAGDISVREVPSATDKSVRMLDGSAVTGSGMEKTFAAQSGPVAIEASVRPEQTNHGLEMHLMSGGTEVGRVRFHSSGNITYIDDAGEHTVQSYGSGSFYNVRMAADAATDTFDLYINGTLVAQNRGFINNASSVDKIKFQSFGSTTGTFYVDQVKAAITGDFSVDYVRVQDITAVPTPTPSSVNPPTLTVPSPSNPGSPAPLLLRIDASIRAEQTNHGMDMMMMSGNAEVARVRMHSSGNISYMDNGGEHVIQAYSSGVFYDIGIVADSVHHTFDVYINGTIEAVGRPYINNAGTVDSVKFETFGSTTGTFYVDDVHISETP